MATTGTQPNLDEIQHKLAEFLTDSGWRNKLKTFIQSDEFKLILTKLHELRCGGLRFTPPVKDILRCFAVCPYDKLRVVIMGPGPYSDFTDAGAPYADGLLYSHKPGCIVKGQNASIREATGSKNQDPDLTRWANQGVLLLPSALTATAGADMAHHELYKGMMGFVLDTINSLNQGLVFLFIGDEAKEFSELISDKRHYVFHLASLNQAMNANYTFGQIDKILRENWNTSIDW